MRIPETDIRRVFHASLWVKGAHSLTEVLGGLALAFLRHDLIVRMATARTRAELIGDTRDLVANAELAIRVGLLPWPPGAAHMAAQAMARRLKQDHGPMDTVRRDPSSVNLLIATLTASSILKAKGPPQHSPAPWVGGTARTSISDLSRYEIRSPTSSTLSNPTH